MPKYAFLETALLCPQCKTQIADLLWFQWGYCSSRDPQPENLYHVGDSIHWRRCTDGSTPAWTYFLDKPTQPANIGEPTVQDILVQEAVHFFWDPVVEAVRYDPRFPPTTLDSKKIYYGGQHPPNQPRICPMCQTSLAGAFIEIRDNIITKAWIYLPGEFDHHIDYHVIATDGSIVPMGGWSEHPMTRRDRC